MKYLQMTLVMISISGIILSIINPIFSEPGKFYDMKMKSLHYEIYEITKDDNDSSESEVYSNKLIRDKMDNILDTNNQKIKLPYKNLTIFLALLSLAFLLKKK